MFIRSIAITVMLGVGGAAMAEESAVSLFDGETLSGWTSSEENASSFSVQDGAIVAHGPRAHLYYTGESGDASYTNFELRLKAMTTPGSNSGVYFDTTYQAEGWPEKGFEAQVNSTQVDPKKTGSLYGILSLHVPGEDEEPFIVKRVDDAGVLIARERAPSTDGEWFDYVIRVEDRTITISVDGMTTVAWTQPEDWTDPDHRLDGGTFALQAHDPDSEVWFKDLELVVLD